MLKQKQLIAAVLVSCLFLAVFIASIYMIKLSKSLIDILPNGEPLASFENFHVIAHDLDAMGDLKAECKAQLGNGMRLADWNDIAAFYETGGSLDDFIKGLKMSNREDMIDLFSDLKGISEKSSQDNGHRELPYAPGGYRITYNGIPRWDETGRHYFVARHDHIKPPGFLEHDHLNDFHLTVGSWFAQGGYALCYGEINENSTDVPLASYKDFHVISHNLNEMEDHNAECIAQLGENVRLADWNDIVAYYDASGELSEFIIRLRMSLREDMKAKFYSVQSSTQNVDPNEDSLHTPDLIANEYRISKDGNLRWQEDRHYFVGRHDHLKPYGFLDHDNLNNYQLTLGSRFGRGGFALCYGRQSGISIPMSKALKSTIPIIAYLLVVCIFLGTTFVSINILKIPNWLIGRNTDAIKQNIEMKRNEIAGLEKLQANITKMDSDENSDDVTPESNS